MTNNYKIILVSVFSLLVMAVTAQLPNAGFENWHTAGFPSYDEPDNWGTLNSSTSIISVFTTEKANQANSHSGNYAAKLSTHFISFANQTAPGITVSNATINTTTQAVNGGFTYTQRANYLVGWYKGTPAANDSSSVELSLWRWNSGTHTRDEIGTAKFYNSATVGTYTKFIAPITYTLSGVPDSALIILSSSNTAHPVDGSVFYIDDLALINCSTFTATAAAVNATCTSANGSATVTAASASTYDWSNSTHNSSLTNVAAGTYSVTVHDDNGCSASATTTIGTTNTAINPSATSAPATCTASNGTALGSASAGTTPYTYLWSTGAITASINNLAAGTYNVTLTDANGCSGTASTTVQTAATAITSTISATTTSCVSSTGTATVTPTNGTANYSYLWSNAATTNAISGLSAGAYQVTITDANGCSGTATTNVTTPNGPSATQAVTNVNCFGAANGAVDVTTTGGTGVLAYSWNPGAQTTQDLSGLSGGTYTLTISDDNNCSFTLTAIVNEPSAPLTSNSSSSSITCNGQATGSVSVTVSGGTPNYTYLWNNTATTPDLSSLSAGTYLLTITDNNGCTLQFTQVLTEPTAIVPTVTTTDVLCYGATNGAGTASATGGTPPYTYTWTGGATGPTPATLAAGTVTVTVTDDNFCSVSTTSTIAQPTQITVTTNVTDATSAGASDGSIAAVATGGTPAYTYTWSGGGNGSNLAPGNHCVTVTDGNACSVSACATVGFANAINNVASTKLLIYPNPANNQLVIETTEGKYLFTVYSIDGKLQTERTIAGEKSVINVEQLAVGFYAYQLKNLSNGNTSNGKLQIVR